MTTPPTFRLQGRDVPWLTGDRAPCSERCAHCGAETREIQYQLTECHVAFLRVMRDVGLTDEWAPKRKKELGITDKTVYNNGHAAWKWGLLRSVEGQRLWQITQRGLSWLDGTIAVPSSVVMLYRGVGSEAQVENVVRYEGAAVRVSDITARTDEETGLRAAREKAAARAGSV